MAIVNNDFHQILTERHSVRRFDPTVKISRAEIKEMLQETITAPSACNLQAWKFIVVDTDEGRKKLHQYFMKFNFPPFYSLAIRLPLRSTVNCGTACIKQRR